jgi:hypothetical protein
MKYLIVIVILLVLVILFLLGKSKLTQDEEYSYIHDNLYNPKWNKYRLGDVYQYSHQNKVITKKEIKYDLKHFPDSIAVQYLKENKEKKSNLNLLCEILRNRLTNSIGSIDSNKYPDTLFLHIRIGDILCAYKDDKSDSYSKINNPEWWQKEIVDIIKKNNITKEKILAGTHMNKCIKQSTEYLLDLKKFLIENIPGLQVDIIVDKTPDEIILMCYLVKYFKTTGGNFGRLIAEVNNTNNT